MGFDSVELLHVLPVCTVIVAGDLRRIGDRVAEVDDFFAAPWMWLGCGNGTEGRSCRYRQ